jgi:immunity protein 50 of polymorphic toxin system
MEILTEVILGGRLNQEISLRDIKINKAMSEERVLPYIQGADKLVSRFGAFPMFSDSEVLTVVLHRDSLAATFTLLVSEFKDRVHCGNVEIVLEFLDIENLRLEGFNYQNVVSNLTFDVAIEQSLYSQVEVPRIHVDLDTNFGVWATFTCSRVVVQRVETSTRRTGDPSYLKKGTD